MTETVQPKFSPYEDDFCVGRISDQVGETPVEGEWIRLKKKIPRGVYDQICEVLNYGQKVHSSEAYFLLRYPGEQWAISVPPQWVGPAHVCGHPELEAGKHNSAMGDGHGHPNMSAFHSGIDHADEHKHRHGIFMVLSSTEAGYSLLTSVVDTKLYVRGRVFDLHPLEVFDLEDRSPVPPLQEGWQKKIVKAECPKCPKIEYAGFGGSYGGLYGGLYEGLDSERPGRFSGLRDWFFNRGKKKKKEDKKEGGKKAGFDPDNWRIE